MGVGRGKAMRFRKELQMLGGFFQPKIDIKCLSNSAGPVASLEKWNKSSVLSETIFRNEVVDFSRKKMFSVIFTFWKIGICSLSKSFTDFKHVSLRSAEAGLGNGLLTDGNSSELLADTVLGQQQVEPADPGENKGSDPPQPTHPNTAGSRRSVCNEVPPLTGVGSLPIPDPLVSPSAPSGSPRFGELPRYLLFLFQTGTAEGKVRHALGSSTALGPDR